ANVSYFSSIESSQTYNTNIYDASRNQRTFGGNLVGAWSSYTLNATLDHSEYFYSTTDSSITGTWPRIQFSRNERPLPGSPAYFSVTTEFAHILRDTKSTSTDPSVPSEIDSGLSRFDVAPQLRYPFKKWQWFTVNTSISAHETYYSRSYVPSPDPLQQ